MNAPAVLPLDKRYAPGRQTFAPEVARTCPAPIFSEPLCALEFLNLRISPAYRGVGVPRGDGAAVVVIPGFLGTDIGLFELHDWLKRIGYRPYYSGIALCADCPDRLIRRLDATIDRAYAETGARVHLIGHSLGGIFARTAAARRPEHIASVISLGSPYRGLVMHRFVQHLSDALRSIIRNTRPDMPKACVSTRCSCLFGQSLALPFPRSVRQTAIYTKCDGIVDWRYCRSGEPDIDIEVVGTHLGLPYNARVFWHIAQRLASESE